MVYRNLCGIKYILPPSAVVPIMAVLHGPDPKLFIARTETE